MQKGDLRKTINYIFFPAFLLSFFLFCSSALFSVARDSVLVKIIHFSKTPALIPALKTSILPFQIILAILVLIFSIYKPFEKVFKGTLLALIGIITFLTVMLFFQEHFVLEKVSDAFGLYKPLIAHWHITLTYIALNLLKSNLFLILIWGFINRLTSLSLGTRYYIPFTFIIGATGGVIATIGFATLKPWEWSIMSVLIPAIVFMILSFITFILSWKRLPDSLINTENSPATPAKRFPFLSAAYLLAGTLMASNILNTLLKAQLRDQTPNPSAYANIMGQYSMIIGFSGLGFSLIWVVLGTLLILKKGWKFTALTTSISTIIGGIFFLFLPITPLNLGIVSGLFEQTTSLVFFSLIQLLYLSLPYQNRFKTKLVTEMIALPIFLAIPTFSIQALFVIFGSMAAISLYLKIIVPLLLALLIVASLRAGSKFENSSKQTV